MKNLIFTVFALLLITACNTPRQQTTPPATPNPENSAIIDSTVSANADRGVLMKNGMMMTMQNGELVPMKTDTTFGNGDRVMMNGDIIRKDGTKMKMAEGMMIDNTGAMIDANGKKMNTPEN